MNYLLSWYRTFFCLFFFLYHSPFVTGYFRDDGDQLFNIWKRGSSRIEIALANYPLRRPISAYDCFKEIAKRNCAHLSNLPFHEIFLWPIVKVRGNYCPRRSLSPICNLPKCLPLKAQGNKNQNPSVFFSSRPLFAFFGYAGTAGIHCLYGPASLSKYDNPIAISFRE